MKKDVLDTATRMGELLLDSGAEIARVEESMERVCRYYGAEGASFYVLSNGIFLTAEDARGNCYMARLCSSAFVALSARVLAVRQHCPGIILMIPGLFPLIPGGSVYWTVHHLVANRLSLASETGFNALKLAVALVFGIVLVFELPQDLFRPAGPSGQRKRRARKKH